MVARDAGNVLLPFTHILATLHHDGAQTQLDETQGSKQPTRSGTDDDDLRTPLHLRIMCRHVRLILRLFVDVTTHLQVDVDGPLAGIDAPLQDTQCREGTYVDSLLTRHVATDVGFTGCLSGQYSQLVFYNHSSSILLIRHLTSSVIRRGNGTLLPPCAPPPAQSSPSTCSVPAGCDAG